MIFSSLANFIEFYSNFSTLFLFLSVLLLMKNDVKPSYILWKLNQGFCKNCLFQKLRQIFKVKRKSSDKFSLKQWLYTCTNMTADWLKKVRQSIFFLIYISSKNKLCLSENYCKSAILQRITFSALNFSSHN